MRLAYKVWSGVAAAVFCTVAVTDLSSTGSRPAAETSALTTPSVEASAAPVAAAGSSGSAPVAEGVRVIDVIDGDTFRVTGGDEVRVLGIDSCEHGTPGGTRATAAATSRLLGEPVTLTAEPGVDRDRYGRMLRYVSVAGGDFASALVREDHTAIYTRGRNDASPAVQARLRALDTDGRTCGTGATPTTITTSTARPAPSTRMSTPSPDVDRPRTPRPAVGSTGGATGRGATGGGATGGGATSYPNCTAARAAGAAPLYAGQPGYSTRLDRDRDGVACE